MKKQAMAAQYTPIGIGEMDKFLRRAFRALNPRSSVIRGEAVYDLFITDRFGVRVWTSISPHSEEAAAVGADAIRVQYFDFRNNRPLVRGKAPIVKRTQGWRDNLQARIEEVLELYEQREMEFEQRPHG